MNGHVDRGSDRITYYAREGVRVTDTELVVGEDSYPVAAVEQVWTESRLLLRTAVVGAGLVVAETVVVTVAWPRLPLWADQTMLATAAAVTLIAVAVTARWWPRAHGVWIHLGRYSAQVWSTREEWQARQLARAIRRAAAGPHPADAGYRSDV